MIRMSISNGRLGVMFLGAALSFLTVQSNRDTQTRAQASIADQIGHTRSLPNNANTGKDGARSATRQVGSKVLIGDDRRNVLRVEFDPGKSSILGKGTYGTVRRGVELTSGRPVALKIVNKGLRSVIHEIDALRRVRNCGGHPNVVALLGVVAIEDDDSKCGLVFELLEGGELYENLVKHGAYSEARASSVIRQVASALDFLHRDCHIAHADLKPENLLLRTNHEDGATAICDFGSAVELDEGGSFEFSDNRLLGTVAYAAPELLRTQYGTSAYMKSSPKFAERATSAVDVWSLGCILYVVLSGLHPFDPDNEISTDEELAKVILKGTFDFAAPAWKDVSASAKDLIKRMLEKDPGKRITARQILQHDWIRLPQRQEIISGSDVRLIGFLRTQKRLQDHVFHLMLDGSLKSQPRTKKEDDESHLEQVLRTIDTEGKGFITSQDIKRTLEPAQRESQQNAESLEEDDDKLYYSSLNGLVGCGERVAYKPGEVVFRRGDVADSFYFVDRGKVEVTIAPLASNGVVPMQQETSLQLGAGDFFGETALIKNQPRNATVKAGAKGAELIRFSRDDFDRLIAGSDAFKMLDEHVKNRTVEHIKYVFSTLFHDRATIHLSNGDILLKRGEPSDSMFYILEGVADVLSPSGDLVAQRKEGETVGELGLVTGEPRSMDIRCGSPRGCALKKLDRDDLNRLLQFSPLAHAEIQNALSSRGSSSVSLQSNNNAKLNEVEVKRRWTVAQGSAKASKSQKKNNVG